MGDYNNNFLAIIAPIVGEKRLRRFYVYQVSIDCFASFELVLFEEPFWDDDTPETNG